MTMRGFSRRLLLTALGSAALVPAFAADEYPNKPIRIVVGFPAGQGTDTIARAVAPRLQALLGQPLIVDNRPGAGGILGQQTAATATPDGYTILFTSAGPMAVNPGVYAKLPYDPVKDYAPVGGVINVPLVLVANTQLPVKNLKELLALAKAKPGEINFGSSGNGVTNHLAMEMLSQAAGVKMTHVPYKGSAGVVNAMLGGEIDLTFDSISTSMPQIASGRMKALATTGSKRSGIALQVPTMQEAGVPGFVVQGWYAILAPAGTPPAVVNRLSTVIADALKDPDLKETLAASGYEPVGSTPEELGAHIDREIVRWAKVVKDSGARID
jgi:tripartite-type tricarboxylate transporter receptor subunit TctC